MRSVVLLGLAASLAGGLTAACSSDEESGPAEPTSSTGPVSAPPVNGEETSNDTTPSSASSLNPSVSAPSNSQVNPSQAPGGSTISGAGNPGSDGSGGSSYSNSDETSGSEEPGKTDPDNTAPVDTEPDDTGSSQLSPSLPDVTPTEANLTAVPSVRQEHAVVALDGEIYVLGGFTPSVTDTVQAYSPVTDTWRDIAEFPVDFHHPNAGAIGGKIYVAGFLLGSSLSNGDGRVFAYDPKDDEWTPRASMPAGTERGSGCVATLDSKLYVFGGASRTTVPDASAYDTESDTWQDLPFMPELREHCIAATVDGRIYIVSGRAGSIAGVGALSFVYDPGTNTYADRAPIPTPRGGTAGALIYGRIFVFGGEGNPADSGGMFSEVEAYDPLTDTWQSFPSMTIPRHGFGAAALDNRIYLPGGGTRQGLGAVDDHTVFSFQP